VREKGEFLAGRDVGREDGGWPAGPDVVRQEGAWRDDAIVMLDDVRGWDSEG
jgi:hypothetical protein